MMRIFRNMHLCRRATKIMGRMDSDTRGLMTMDCGDLQPLMTPAEVAGVLRMPTDTLAAWRVRKPEALPFVKIGSHVRYRTKDVAAFIEGGARGAEPHGE
jgi:hypothetical protein